MTADATHAQPCCLLAFEELVYCCQNEKKKKWRESEGEEREWGGEKERSRERDYRMNRIQSPTP